MATVSQQVNSLNNGVSLQPQTLRLPSQLDSQENLLSDVVKQLKSRPGANVLYYTGNSGSGSAKSLFFESFIQSNGRRWVTIQEDSGGNITVSEVDDTGALTSITLTTAEKAYLESGSNFEDLRILQTEDRIYIVNRSVIPAMDSALTGTRNPEVLFWARQSAEKIDMTVYLEDAIFTPSGSLASDYDELTDGVSTTGDERLVVARPQNVGPDHSTQELIRLLHNDTTFGGSASDDGLIDIRDDHWFTVGGKASGTSLVTAGYGFDIWDWYIVDDSGSPVTSTNRNCLTSVLWGVADNAAGINHTFTVEDGLGNQAIRIAGPRSVRSLEYLPATGAPTGFHVKVTGANTNEDDDFYVYFDGDVWKEAPAQNIKYIIDADTMPVVITHDGVNFSLDQPEWGERTTGDDTSSPPPSFIGKEIKDIFLHQNRLGIVTEGSVILSEDKVLENFWPTTLRQVLTSDPIDFDLPAVGGIRPIQARFATSVPAGLLVVGVGGQAIVTASDNLWGPGRISADTLSQAEISADVAPLQLGGSVFFPAKSGSNTVIWSYTLSQSGFNLENIAATVEGYLPTNLSFMAGSFTNSILLLGDADNTNEVYVFRWYQAGLGQSRAMSSWSKWVFPTDWCIRSIEMVAGKVQMFVNAERGVNNPEFLVELDPSYPEEAADIPWAFSLDWKLDLSAESWSVDTVAETSTLTLSQDSNDVNVPAGWLVHWDDADNILSVYDHPGGANLTLPAAFTGSDKVWYGIPFNVSGTLSKIFYHQADGRGGVRVLSGGRTQLRYIDVEIVDSGPVDFTVTPKGRPSRTQTSPAWNVGDDTDSLSLPNSRREVVDIGSKNTEVDISFGGQYLTPIQITNYEWTGTYFKKARDGRSS